MADRISPEERRLIDEAMARRQTIPAIKDKAVAKRKARVAAGLAKLAKIRAAKITDRRRFKDTPVPLGIPNRTVAKSTTGTMFPNMVRDVIPGQPVLVDGASNSKIGGDVRVGWLKGAKIFTLTLEERATCPSYCPLWQTCLAPGTRVLTADLRWVPIETLKVGDAIAGFEEFAAKSHRKTNVAVVEKMGRAIQPSYQVVTPNGIVTASAKHRWLARWGTRTDYSWRTTDQLRPGDHLQFFGEPWDTDTSYDAGRLRGFVEGEGSCGVYGNNGYLKSRLGWSQRPTKLCDEIIEVAARLGFKTHRGERIAGVNQTAVSHVDITGGWREVARFLGRIRPTRMIEKAIDIWSGHSIGGRGGLSSEVQSIIPLGDQEVVTIQTSTSTLVAEGFFTHNCYGNSMNWSVRWRPGAALEAQIKADVKRLIDLHGRILVRLHILGDFYSTEYLVMWSDLLEEYPGLAVFGFTALRDDTLEGTLVATIRRGHPKRFNIRHSGRSGPWGSITTDMVWIDSPMILDVAMCPEQRSSMSGDGKGMHCGDCGLCWTGKPTPIGFFIH